MKKLLILALLCGAVMAQDNVQTVTLTSNPVSSLVVLKDHNEGRGGPEFRIGGIWTGVPKNWNPGGFLNLRTNESEALPIPSNYELFPEYVEFVEYNAHLQLPFIITPVNCAITTATPAGSFSLEPLGGGDFVRAFYTPVRGFVGQDIAVVSFTSNGNVVAKTTVTFNVINTKPTLALEASPRKLAPGGTVALLSTTGDADGHPVSVTYNYGDGSTGTEAFRTYQTPGIYTITATANDGFDSVTASITVEVVGVDRVPVPRFTTSDVVGFVGVPFLFDAAFSTDPQNSALTYAWDFGDGSPVGSGQATSRTYTADGSYLVTLTVRNAEGIPASTARVVEILPAALIGTFNAGVEFTTKFDRSTANKDTLTLKATLNVGDTQVGEGTVVALVIAGQRFEATLTRRFKASVTTNPKQSWTVKFGTRKQAAGEVELRATIRNCSVGQGFNQLGAVIGADASELVTIEVPVHVEVGAKVFEVTTEADFKFNRSGQRAKGEGASE